MSTRNPYLLAIVCFTLAAQASSKQTKAGDYFLRLQNPTNIFINYTMNGEKTVIKPGYTTVHRNRDGHFRMLFDHSFQSGNQNRLYALRANSTNVFRKTNNGIDLYWDGQGGIEASKLRPRFPIKVSTPDKKVTSRGKMRSTITIDQTGLVRGTTYLRVRGGVKGFTGGVSLVFLGENDVWLGDHYVGRWGVDCASCIWATHRGRRDVNWKVQLNSQQLARLRRIAVVHSHDPKPLTQVIRHAGNKGQSVVETATKHGAWIAALL